MRSQILAKAGASTVECHCDYRPRCIHQPGDFTDLTLFHVAEDEHLRGAGTQLGKGTTEGVDGLARLGSPFDGAAVGKLFDLSVGDSVFALAAAKEIERAVDRSPVDVAIGIGDGAAADGAVDNGPKGVL